MAESRRVRTWPRRVAGLVVVCGLLVAGVAAYRAAPTASQYGMAAVPSASDRATTKGTGRSNPDRSGTTPGSDRSSTSTSSPGSTGAPDGPGTTEPGILIMAAPTADGAFEVVEMVRLPRQRFELSLRPPDITRAGEAFADLRPVARDVQATAGDQPVEVPDAMVREPVELSLFIRSDVFVLRYRLDQTMVRSIPSTAGRARAAIGPLTDEVPDDLPVRLMVTGDSVRNLVCPALDYADQACADGERPQLMVRGSLPRKDFLVVVQLDLPMPR